MLMKCFDETLFTINGVLEGDGQGKGLFLFNLPSSCLQTLDQLLYFPDFYISVSAGFAVYPI